MNKWLEKLSGWFVRPNPDAPTTPASPASIPYLKVWRALKEINFKDLWIVFLTAPVIVFFAVSGLVAWLVVLAKFVLSLLNVR